MMPLYYIPKTKEKHSLLTPDEKMFIDNLAKLPKQIENVSQLVEMSGEEFNLKQVACSKLQEILRKYYPDCLLLMFGSAVNGVGIKNRFLDLLFLPFPTYCNLDFPRSEPRNVSMPSPASVLTGETSRDVLLKFDEWSHLVFIRNVLRGEKTYVKRLAYIPTKYPSLKAYLSNDNVACDFSVSNRFVIFNSELLQFFVKLDERVKPLVLTLKCWALSLGFISPKFFSENAFALLIIFFLQNVNPPILPSVKHLMDLSIFSRIVSGWQTAFTTDKSLIQESKNIETLGELFIHFFDYYWNFDFSQFIVSPYSGKPLSINDLKNSSDGRLSSFEISSLSIQDPFILSQNICKTDGPKRSVFKLAALTAYHLIKAKDKINFCTLFDFTAYQTIFDSKYSEYMIGVSPKVAFISLDCELVANLSKATKNHQLWYERICQTVFDVLQYGLLIECEITDKISWDKKMNTSSTNKVFDQKNFASENEIKDKFHLDSTLLDLELLMSIQCSLYSRTWVGRKSITETSLEEAEKDFHESALKTEYEISMEIVRKNPRHSNPIFCFKCDCYKHASPQIPDVLVMAKPLVYSKEFIQVATFLASFIPKTVKKILASN